MIHLDYLAATRISGPDAGSFLQSQLSADIAALEPGRATFAAYCTPRGQVLGLLLVCHSGDGFFLVSSAELLAGIVKRLKIFVMRSKLAWDESGETAVLGLEPGEEAASGVSRYATALPSLNYGLVAAGNGSAGGVENWKSRELQLGVAWLDAATTEKFIPQMLGEDAIGAVSFSKGCYPGQEIVARTRYLGKVKRKPLIVSVAGAVQLENASKLEIYYAGESVPGTLIDSAKSDTGNTVLFIVTNLLEDQEPVSVSSEAATHAIIA